MPIAPTNYRKTRKIIQRGSRANQPGATTVLEGTLYFVTDEQKLERASSSAWEAVSKYPVDLTADITGDLPFANIAQMATASVLGRNTASTGDIEVLGTLPSAVQDNITRTGTITSGTWSGSFGAVSGANLTSLTAANISAGTAGIGITGNAGSATALQNARTINGVSFNGTANITVTAAAGTLTGSTLNSGVTASSLTSFGTLTGLTVSGTTSVAALTASGTASVAELALTGVRTNSNTGSFSLSLTNDSWIKWNGSGTGTLNQVTGGAAGQLLVITNTGSSTLTVSHGTGASEFNSPTDADISLGPDDSIVAIKDGGSAWRIISFMI